MRARWLGLIAFSLIGVLPAWSAKQPITETDLLKIQRVTEVEVTPDGSFAIYGVQSIHTEPPSTPTGDPICNYRVNLWMADLRDSAVKPVQLTFGDRHDSMLAISPDGLSLAFIRAEGNEKPQTSPEPVNDKKPAKPHPQLWIMSLRKPGEPRMVTHLEFGVVGAPRWRSDGTALLVSSPIPISKLGGKPTFDLERPGRDWWDFDRPQAGNPDGDLKSIRDWLEHNAERNDPTDITRIGFLGELSLNGEMTMNELFRVDLGAEITVTQLTKTYYDHNQALFSPHGDRILFAGRPQSTFHPDRLEDKSVIWEMNADGSNEHVLLGDERYSFHRPTFTKDGRHLILIGQQNDEPTYRQAMLAECDPDGSHLSWLTKDGDPGVQQPEASSDGRVYYTVDYHGGQPLRSVDLKNACNRRSD